MLGVLAALLDFDDSRSSLATFIDRIAESKTTSVLRRTAAKKRNPKDVSLVPREPVKIFLSIELRLDLERALKKLAKKDRDVARLLVEYKPAETARVPQKSRVPESIAASLAFREAPRGGRFLNLFHTHRTLLPPVLRI